MNVHRTSLRVVSNLYTSAMSATHKSLVTEDNNSLDARIIELRFGAEIGSAANSRDEALITSPKR